MSNPFEALNISDDQDEQFTTATGTVQARKTHKERRQLKKQTQNAPTTQTQVNSEIPVHRAKETGFEHKHKREGGRPVKGIPEGHTLDRRSGTGRSDRPRKQGGGYGNIGNAKDELNKQKYEKPTEPTAQSAEELPAVVEETKPQQPQKPTLAEYYQSKGIELNTGVQKKAVVKSEVNAEWLKKEKLTVIETKEDKKRQDAVKQNVLQHNNTKVQLGFGNSELLGFGTKTVQRPREEEHHHQDHKHQKGRKGPKVNLKEDDFPTL